MIKILLKKENLCLTQSISYLYIIFFNYYSSLKNVIDVFFIYIYIFSRQQTALFEDVSVCLSVSCHLFTAHSLTSATGVTMWAALTTKTPLEHRGTQLCSCHTESIQLLTQRWAEKSPVNHQPSTMQDEGKTNNQPSCSNVTGKTKETSLQFSVLQRSNECNKT